MTDLRTGVRLGAAYYNEYLPDPSRLQEDLELMGAAGIRCIRVGESVWSTWEPEDGRFDLEWMTPILDAAHGHGITVILGTPTYAVPPWLAVAHPDLAVQRADGTRVPWGGRQEVDYTSPVFRRYAERIIRAVIGRHGRHPAVAGVQLDNEAGLHLIHNDHVVARFRAWIAQRYGTPEALNEAWGLTYWSHCIASWDELWAPEGNTTPAYALAWRRFQAEQTTDFLAWQAGLVRPLVAEGTVLTTCIAYGRPAMDDVAVADVLDIVSGNAYFEAQDSLVLAHTASGDEWFAADVAQLLLSADRMRASADAPFLVTETGAGSIGAAHQTRPAYAGQLAQAAWLLVARGARLVSYWHWHTLHSGHEAHWGGILGHDLRPGRVYREIAAIGAQFDAAQSWISDAQAEADVAVVIAHDSEWVTAAEPPLRRADGSADPRAYGRIVQTFARGIVDAGRQIAVLNERGIPDAAALRERFDAVVVPGLVAASDRTLHILAAYARLGGTLVVGPRTGFGDDEGRVRSTAAPGVLVEVLGAGYDEFAALRSDVPIEGFGGGVAMGWIDAYEPRASTHGIAAEVLARYAHPHYGAYAAVTRCAFGLGAAYAIGTLPDRALLARILEEALPTPRRLPPFVARPASVTVHTLVGARGRVWVLHNWAAEPADLVLRRRVVDVLGAEDPVEAGRRIRLGAWGVAVWGEAHPTRRTPAADGPADLGWRDD